jgi:hypothetical protein
VFLLPSEKASRFFSSDAGLEDGTCTLQCVGSCKEPYEFIWSRKEKEVFEGDPTSVPACAPILSHIFESSMISDPNFYCLRYLSGFNYESTSKQRTPSKRHVLMRTICS